MARLVAPSRLELNRPEGSGNAAPFANVSFTLSLYVSPVQMMPSCDQTGTPGLEALAHFHSSTTPGSACLMVFRTCASVSPRQSSSSLTRASTFWEADFVVAVLERLFAFMVVVVFFADGISHSHSFARKLAGLLHPRGELLFVQFALVDV